MKIKTVLFLMGFMLFPISSNGEMLDYITYYDHTEKSETVAWDPSENAEYYKFEAFHYERKTSIVIGSTSQTQIVVNFPKSGHYVFKVKSCTSQSKDENGNDLCSEYAESTNSQYATVNGEAKSWWVYRHVSPPGEVIVE